jgi:hypothetical protein
MSRDYKGAMHNAQLTMLNDQCAIAINPLPIINHQSPITNYQLTD